LDSFLLDGDLVLKEEGLFFVPLLEEEEVPLLLPLGFPSSDTTDGDFAGDFVLDWWFGALVPPLVFLLGDFVSSAAGYL
jgi:hypothetical protein